MLLLFKNSLILAVSITFLNTFLSAMAGYAVAKIPFPGRNQIFSFMLATMMIPGVLFLIPTYVMMYRLGWVGHFYALIIPSAISVYNIFLIRQFVIGIPNEQIEAARLDGANDIQIFTKIILPLSRACPGDRRNPQLHRQLERFSRPAALPKPPGDLDGPAWSLPVSKLDPGEHIQELWASMTMITVPLILVYFLLQDQFIKAFANMSFKSPPPFRPRFYPPSGPRDAATTADPARQEKVVKNLLLGMLILAALFLITYAGLVQRQPTCEPLLQNSEASSRQATISRL